MSSRKKTVYNPNWEDSSLHPNIAGWIMKDNENQKVHLKKGLDKEY